MKRFEKIDPDNRACHILQRFYYKNLLFYIYIFLLYFIIYYFIIIYYLYFVFKTDFLKTDDPTFQGEPAAKKPSKPRKKSEGDAKICRYLRS